MLGFLDLSEREDVISQVQEEATTLAESVSEFDDMPQTNSGTQWTKGEHKLMKLLGDVLSSGEHRRSTFKYFTFSKSQSRSQ